MEGYEHIKRFFDERAALWDTLGHSFYPAMLRGLLQAAGLKEGLRVLDIACGTGVMFPLLLESKPALLHGIDLSEEMVKHAREKASGAEVFAADLYSYEPDEVYDFALIYNAYPHFTDKALFAKKLHALLNKGGRFLLMHGAGRGEINARHNASGAKPVSVPLLPCAEEAPNFEGLFQIDMMIDTDFAYAISGTAL